MDCIDDELLLKFKEIAKRFYLLQKKVATELKINMQEYKVITILAVNEEVNQTALSDICGIDKPAMSRLLFRLQIGGTILKTCHENNRKNIYIKISEKGRKIAGKIKQKIDKYKSEFFNPIDKEEKQIIENLLSKVLV